MKKTVFEKYWHLEFIFPICNNIFFTMHFYWPITLESGHLLQELMFLISKKKLKSYKAPSLGTIKKILHMDLKSK